MWNVLCILHAKSLGLILALAFGSNSLLTFGYIVYENVLEKIDSVSISLFIVYFIS